MDLLEKIEQLPETVPADQLAPYFSEAIAVDTSRSYSIEEKETFLLPLIELADKQWHNHVLIDTALGKQIDAFLIFLMRGPLSVELLESAIAIISRLGLDTAYRFFRQLGAGRLSSEMRTVLDDAVEEFGDSVADPYASFPQ